MVQTKRETPGKTPRNKGVKLRTEEEEETAQESTQNEGQAAKQISIEVEGNRYNDQSGVEKAEVDQKVAEATEANAMNREDKSTEPKISEKMVSAKKNRKRNAAKLVAGAENTGSLAAEMVDVDRFAGEQRGALIVADKPRNEEYVEGEQKNEVIVDCRQKIGKYGHECVRKAKLEMESSQTVKKILEVAKTDDLTVKQVELQQNESEKEIEVTIESEAKQKLSEKMKIDETVEKKIENEQREGKRKKRKRAEKVMEGEENSEQKSVPNAKLEMESPQMLKKILEAAEADESTGEKVELQQNESEKENEVTVKTETKQELSEKIEIDEMEEKKIEDEESEGKLKKSKKRKRAKKVKEGEPQTVKKILEVAEADESTAKKVQLQQNESEKEVEVTVKTEKKQELSEKMEINEMVEKKIENEESECKLKKSKKRKRAKKVKEGEPQTVKKILEVAEADESTAKKMELQQYEMELQQNESEKEIEVTMKIETKQKLSEKMEIDERVEKKVETEQSEGMRRKRKKRKRADKVKGEVKKITEEDRDGKKIPLEVKKKTTVEEGHMKKITEEEREVKKITQGEGQFKTTKVDGTVEEKPENDQCKSEKGNGTCIKKEGQMKKTGQEEIITEEEQKKSDATEVIEMLVNSLTKDELKEVLKSYAQKEPGLLVCINSVASRNKLKRTLYVRNLKCDTKSKTLRGAFFQYGKIENAKVFADKESGKHLGFGFVEFRTKSSALSALRDPVKEINGQKCHCALKLPRRRSSNKSYMAIHGPRESVYPGILVPGRFIDPTSLGRGEYIHGQKEAVYPGMLGPGGFVDPTLLGRGEYANPTVFMPMVNSASFGHLNSQAVQDNIQFSNYWGRSNLHEY